MSATTKVIKVVNLSKVYSRPVLKNISFEITAGETVALVGANGAGKSTLLKCLLGLIYPQQGEITFFGKYAPAAQGARERTGFLPELVGFWPEMTPIDVLKLCSRARTTLRRIDDVLGEVGLESRSHSRIGEFSKGMTQRLGLACLLLRSPQLLILDEPMTGLDFRAQEWLRHFLKDWRRSEKTLFISTHSLRDVEFLADRVVVLDEGNLVSIGKKEAVLPDLYRWREQFT